MHISGTDGVDQERGGDSSWTISIAVDYITGGVRDNFECEVKVNAARSDFDHESTRRLMELARGEVLKKGIQVEKFTDIRLRLPGGEWEGVRDILGMRDLEPLFPETPSEDNETPARNSAGNSAGNPKTPAKTVPKPAGDPTPAAQTLSSSSESSEESSESDDDTAAKPKDATSSEIDNLTRKLAATHKDQQHPFNKPASKLMQFLDNLDLKKSGERTAKEKAKKEREKAKKARREEKMRKRQKKAEKKERRASKKARELALAEAAKQRAIDEESSDSSSSEEELKLSRRLLAQLARGTKRGRCSSDSPVRRESCPAPNCSETFVDVDILRKHTTVCEHLDATNALSADLTRSKFAKHHTTRVPVSYEEYEDDNVSNLHPARFRAFPHSWKSAHSAAPRRQSPVKINYPWDKVRYL